MAFTDKSRASQTYTVKARSLPATSARYGIGKFGQARYGNTAGYQAKARSAQTYTDKARPS